MPEDLKQDDRARRHGDALVVAVFVSQLREIDAGKDPILTRSVVKYTLPAKGYPLPASAVDNLVVETFVLCGQNAAPWSRWREAAEEYITHHADKPNRKIAAAATARAARAARSAK